MIPFLKKPYVTNFRNLKWIKIISELLLPGEIYNKEDLGYYEFVFTENKINYKSFLYSK